MASYNGSLEAVDCHTHSVRYDMVLESRACGRLRCLVGVAYTATDREIEIIYLYDMVLESRACGHPNLGLISSPTATALCLG
eukprot:scaffold16610_cov100-Skeletonema_dohrnii-CCMP3373.AAC.1